MDRDRIQTLASRLYPKFSHTDTRERIAEHILADPQAHVDTLVEAGVLKEGPFNPDLRPMYHVVQPEPPHEHSFNAVKEVIRVSGNRTVLVLLCACGSTVRIPNELPVKDPYSA
jgi:hypothetical protein